MSTKKPSKIDQTWIAKPTRPGWWWRFIMGNIEMCEVRIQRKKLCVWNQAGRDWSPASKWPGKWSGPVDPPKPPTEHRCAQEP